MEASQTVAAQGEYEFVQQLTVDKPSLWSPANPYLYSVRSTVHDAGQVVDDYETPFGIREAIFDAERGFLLNGEHVKLNGVCLHHDAGCVGAAVPERVWERRLELARWAATPSAPATIRPPPEFLDLCDRMGFLVMNEAFDEWKAPQGADAGNGYHLYFDEWHERDLIEFHPSRPQSSFGGAVERGNEIRDQTDPERRGDSAQAAAHLPLAKTPPGR